MAEYMQPDERQEFTTFARSVGERARIYHESLIREGLPEHVADGMTVAYARNFVVPQMPLAAAIADMAAAITRDVEGEQS